MRAIKCTECGATIENVSDSSLIITCDYCGARIMLDQRPAPLRQEPVDAPNLEINTSAVGKVIFFIVGTAVVVPLILGLVIFVNVPSRSTPARVHSASTEPSGYPTPPQWGVSTDVPAKPFPVVNYQPRVSWDGPNDMAHFENPVVDIATVAHLTSEEVEKTVFKNRIVILRVVINTEGEIDSVETISGHPLLVDAATVSAKSSIFRARPKPTTRVLTYTFRVLKD